MPVSTTQKSQYGLRENAPRGLRRLITSPYFTPAANPTDVAGLVATAYATVLRVDRVVLSGVADTAAVIDVLVQQAPSNNTGTSVSPIAASAWGLNAVGALAMVVPSTNAQLFYYTANKTNNGNGVSGTRPAIAARRMQFGTSSAVGSPAVFEWPAGTGPEIRDLNTSIVVNLAGQAMPANAQLRIDEIVVSEVRVPRVSLCGDSTWAAAGEAWWAVNTSGNLTSSAAVDNLSTSGSTLADYLAGTNGIFFPQSAVVPYRSGDVVAFGYGLNDVRTGASQATLTSRLDSAIQAVYAAEPRAKIILCSPNYPAADDPTAGGFLPLTGQFAGLTLTQAAQLCGDICRAAYESFRSDPRVFSVFHRSDYLGRTAVTVANSGAAIGLPASVMTDQLHPNALGRRTWALPFRDVLASAVAARMAEIDG